MISKNEESNIGRCIKSIKHIAEEIIVVDTGSTDKTVEIAQNLGAKVFFHPWSNDFSAARNVSIQNASKDWILFLDCDEEMAVDQANMLKTLINTENVYEGYYLRLINIIENKEISDAIVFRLFKNDKDYKFKGKMHEQIINSIQNKHGLNCVGATPIRIFHYGYDPQVADTDKKSKRNLTILLDYEEKDKDGYYYYVLGNEYARANNYDEALRCYKISRDITNIKQFRYIYYPYLVMNIVRSLYVQKKYNDELKALKEFQKELPDFKDLYFMEALLHIDCVRLTKAKEALLKYLQCTKGQYEYPSNNFDNYYNIAKLMYDLDQGMIDHNEKTLTVWINLDNNVSKAVECIKSVNEISYEIIVLTNNYNNIDLNDIEQIGGKVVKISKANINKTFQIAMKNSRGKYILILNEDNLCSQAAQMQLMYLLKDDYYDGYLIKECNMQSELIKEEFILFKNNKKITSLNEYKDILKEKKNGIIDSKIIIHKNQV